MNFVKPNVEWWQQTTVAQHIAKVGRICYRSKAKEPDEGLTEDEKWQFRENQSGKFCDNLWEKGHRSMYRHGSVYFYVKHQGKLPKWIWAMMTASPYISYSTKDLRVWISSNMQFMCEHKTLLDVLRQYEVTEDDFIQKAKEAQCPDALLLLRMTMVVTTQISSSRELNRTSPNNISEQSTRYVNMERKGGVQIAEPHWYGEGSRWQRSLYNCGCKVSEWMYRLLLRSGMKPQDARGVLPLDTYTVVAYTYNLLEWRHILDLRYFGTTGAPHPNAKIVGKEIFEIIDERLKSFDTELNYADLH